MAAAFCFVPGVTGEQSTCELPVSFRESFWIPDESRETRAAARRGFNRKHTVQRAEASVRAGGLTRTFPERRACSGAIQRFRPSHTHLSSRACPRHVAASPMELRGKLFPEGRGLWLAEVPFWCGRRHGLHGQPPSTVVSRQAVEQALSLPGAMCDMQAALSVLWVLYLGVGFCASRAFFNGT